MWSELSGKQKGGLIGLAVVLALVAGYWIGKNSAAVPVQPMVIEPLPGKNRPVDPEPGVGEPIAEIRVHVKGAVAEPGTYDIVKGSRVEDAIAAAGGALASADLNSVNLVKVLEDGDQVVVRAFEGKRLDDVDWPIRINEAPIEQLELIPGIGHSMAVDIVRYRSEVGWIEGTQDLERIPGFGPETVMRMVPYIRFD